MALFTCPRWGQSLFARDSVKIVMNGMGPGGRTLTAPCLSVGAVALFVVKLKPEEWNPMHRMTHMRISRSSGVFRYRGCFSPGLFQGGGIASFCVLLDLSVWKFGYYRLPNFSLREGTDLGIKFAIRTIFRLSMVSSGERTIRRSDDFRGERPVLSDTTEQVLVPTMDLGPPAMTRELCLFHQ